MQVGPGGRLAVLLTPILLMAGCGSGSQQVTEELGNRMQDRLAPQLATGQAGLVRLPDGVQVSLAEDSLFAPGSAQLTPAGSYVLAGVIEGLLAPSLLQIDVTETSPTTLALQQQRVQAIRNFLTDFQLGPQLQAAALQPGTVPTAAPGARLLAITVRINPALPS